MQNGVFQAELSLSHGDMDSFNLPFSPLPFSFRSDLWSNKFQMKYNLTLSKLQ